MTRLHWTEQEVFFVTREKRIAAAIAFEKRPVPECGPILRDKLNGKNSG